MYYGYDNTGNLIAQWGDEFHEKVMSHPEVRRSFEKRWSDENADVFGDAACLMKIEYIRECQVNMLITSIEALGKLRGEVFVKPVQIQHGPVTSRGKGKNKRSWE